MKTFTKPPLSVDNQVDLLISRGLLVTDRPAAIRFLKNVSYYRFSAYCLPFEQKRHLFCPDVTFEQIQELYEFDRRFRLLVGEALKTFEITARVRIGSVLAIRHGAFIHEDPTRFYDQGKHQRWLGDLRAEIERSREVFITHYRNTYLGFPKVPFWVAAEVMSLGTLSQLYTNLVQEDQKLISREFDLHSRVLQSWLHTLTYVRNMCAHHSRLWNRQLAIALELPRQPAWNGFPNNRIGAVLTALLWAQKQTDQDVTDWRTRLVKLLDTKLRVADPLKEMGLPADYQNNQIWTP